jgi:anthranilate synthase component 1
MISPSREEFIEKARQGNLIPVYREILADLETPVSAFLKVTAGGEGVQAFGRSGVQGATGADVGGPNARTPERLNAFLLESVAGGERIGRYSFIGGDPFLVVKTKGAEVEIRRDGVTQRRKLEAGEDPLSVLKELMAGYRFVKDAELPPFCGGAVGYIGYDTVRFFERLPDMKPDDRGLPDCYFVLTDTLLIFDHVRHRIKVLCLARVDEDAEAGYAAAVEKIERLVARLRAPLPSFDSHGSRGTGHESGTAESEDSRPATRDAGLRVTSLSSREEHEAAILKAKEYIAAGDIIQVVLSRRMAVEVSASPFQIYRALRSVNPSPYMFFLQFEECQLIGASPEILVTERAGDVVTRPLAGTVRRGRTPEEDARLEAELLADPKERAEHIMLVDLHRNDIGRVCAYGTVGVDQLMVTEKYSHVIHIVSNVTGKLRPEKDAYDLIRASFPAGTLSGAPKIRAMEIIEELEPVKRGPYGGAIGYFSFSGDMDTAITLRTIVMQGRTAYIQAGGGIVADSDPAAEYQETVNKAGALVRAIEMAEAGLE